MGYLERWDVWLAVIFIILIIMCFWIGKNKDNWDCTRTNTQTSESLMTDGEARVVEMETELPPTNILVNYVQVPPKQLPKQSIGERRCLEVLQDIYGDKFEVQVRPDELKNPDTRRNLELDIYSRELGLACEYDGAQHKKVVKKFHPNGQSDLDAQKKRDALKDRLCREAGIRLIRVPYTVKAEQIEDYIRYELLAIGM